MNPATPPITRPGFEYYNNDFFAVVAPHHRHRRCTVPELRALLTSNPNSAAASGIASVKDKPAHWFRAQLLHYGLKPTDQKGTAVMRLLDALNAGTLKVPEGLRRLEGEMRREWEGLGREIRRGQKGKGGVGSKDAGGKRKRGDDVDTGLGFGAGPGVGLPGQLLGVSMGGGGGGPASVAVSMGTVNINYHLGGSLEGGQGKGKKRKVEEVAQSKSSEKKGAAAKKEAPVKKQAAVKKEAAQKKGAASKKEASAKTQTAVKETPAKKQTAVKKETPAKKQTAVKKETVKKEAATRTTGPTTSAPKLEDRQENIPTQNYPSQKLSLGLLNGAYKIDAQEVNTRNSGMVLCLENTSIWGEFQLGDIEGVLYMPERPWDVSYPDHGGCEFEWRGVDQTTGQVYSGPECRGEMRFLGNGSVEGTFYQVVPDYYGDMSDCDFWGHRTSGRNETRAPRDAWSMREEYERLY